MDAIVCQARMLRPLITVGDYRCWCICSLETLIGSVMCKRLVELIQTDFTTVRVGSPGFANVPPITSCFHAKRWCNPAKLLFSTLHLTLIAMAWDIQDRNSCRIKARSAAAIATTWHPRVSFMISAWTAGQIYMHLCLPRGLQTCHRT